MVRIVTDSPGGLTLEQAAAYDIVGVVPSYVIFGDHSWLEHQTITPAEFHEKLKTDPHFPTTSAPSIGDYIQVYEKYPSDQILSIHLSRHLSAGVVAAQQAAQALSHQDITVVDTQNVSAGETLLVMEAVRLAKEGKTAQEIKTAIEALIPRAKLLVVFDTLENLKRGGRITAAAALFGGLLQTKPIFTVKEGKLEPIERVRTTAKAQARVKEMALATLKTSSDKRYILMHAAAHEAAAKFAAELTAELGVPPMVLIEVGASVAAHSGPGALGIAFFN